MKYIPQFPNLPSGQCFYYRGKELITAQDKERIETLWGKGWSDDTRYVDNHWYDESYQTGHMDVLNVFATIQCNKELNEREEKLYERIRKGKLTDSKSSSYTWVEQKLAWELFYEGYQLYNIDNSGNRIKSINGLSNEVYRIFGLPYTSIMKKVQQEEDKVQHVTEPVKRYDLKFHYEGQASYESAYKCYGVFLDDALNSKYHLHGSFSNSIFRDNLRKACPYVGKIYFSDLFKPNFWQIYVYDNADRDWAVQNVVHFMKTYKGELT